MELKDKLFILAIRNTNGLHISFLSKWLLTSIPEIPTKIP